MESNLSKLESAVFDLCQEVTGGREHMDAYQCLAGVSTEVQRLKDVASSAIIHAAVSQATACDVQLDSLTKLTAALSRIS